MRELLSYNSLFVGQLYEDKSLALRARDLIFITTDLQTVNYYSTIHALELIYFFNNDVVYSKTCPKIIKKSCSSQLRIIYFFLLKNVKMLIIVDISHLLAG